ncbi:HIRAN domain-containing protein [Orenia marismortui]|uniref:HIRAN domain-containing protein n=1 Tax=Orenia marismortui TaxID=46469 RepID=UPI00037A3BBC|nr:HIRAN domain-containing protein [Orenia marismortui]
MSKYEHNGELILTWKSPFSKERIPIGELWEESGLFKFKYIQGSDCEEGNVELAIKHGFIPFGSLENLTREYSSEEMFTSFLNRLPIDCRDNDPLKVLHETGGELATDSLKFMKKYNLKVKEVSLKMRVSGFEFIVKEEVLNTLTRYTEIILEFDKDNLYDTSSIEVLTKGSKNKLGYIPDKYKEYIIPLVENQNYNIKINNLNNKDLLIEVSGNMMGIDSNKNSSLNYDYQDMKDYLCDNPVVDESKFEGREESNFSYNNIEHNFLRTRTDISSEFVDIQSDVDFGLEAA